MKKIFIIIKIFILLIFLTGSGGVSAECGCTKMEHVQTPLDSTEKLELSNLSIGELTTKTSIQSLPIARSPENGTLPTRSSSSKLSINQCKPYLISAGLTSGTEETWPSPIISSLYPSSVIAGNSDFTLTIDGNNYINETRVLWDAKDYTKAYLSPYQITAQIPASEIATPGQHFIWVNNPSPCGGDSNIIQFLVTDTGQTFPLSTTPLIVQNIKGHTDTASITVKNPSKGLMHFNITLNKNPGAPFSFYFSDFPPWVSSPQVIVVDENRMIITGENTHCQQVNETDEIILVNLSIIGNQAGGDYLSVILNEARADDGSRYGYGYTAVPVVVGELAPFNAPAGGTYPLPTDPDRDGLYEDINGNMRLDFSDITTYANNIDFITRSQPVWVFDYDQNGPINLNDVVTLFQKIL